MRNILINDVEMDAAQVIKGLRTEKGLTLRQLATKARVSKSALSRWERRERVPNLDAFIRIIKSLDSDIVVIRSPKQNQKEV